jgi:hypothetical protein
MLVCVGRRPFWPLLATGKVKPDPGCSFSLLLKDSTSFFHPSHGSVEQGRLSRIAWVNLHGEGWNNT